jgi:hypothetical protein
VRETERTQPIDDSAVAGEQGVSLGGWLLVPAIGLVVVAPVALARLVHFASIYSGATGTDRGVAAFHEAAFHLVVFVLVARAAILFFGRRRTAPSAMITLLVAAVVIHTVVLTIELTTGLGVFAIETGKALARDTVVAAIGIPYFLRSERVKATFVR